MFLLLFWPKTSSNRTHKLIQVLTSSCILIQNRSSERLKFKRVSLSVAIWLAVHKLVSSRSQQFIWLEVQESLSFRRSELRYTDLSSSGIKSPSRSQVLNQVAIHLAPKQIKVTVVFCFKDFFCFKEVLRSSCHLSYMHMW